jgi:hypothetical protein
MFTITFNVWTQNQNQDSLEEKGLFYQQILNFMLFLTSFQLHNYIYFEKFHVDGETYQINQIIY